VHLIALGEQQLGQIRAVLAGDAGNESFFHRNTCFPMVKSALDVNWHVLPANTLHVVSSERKGTVKLQHIDQFCVTFERIA